MGWLTVMDGGGYVPRSTVLGATRRRYGLDLSLDSLLTHYRRGMNSHISCPGDHLRALRAARAAGWTIAIVSNGGTTAQLAKIRRTGLGSLVDAWVVSEEAGCAKPDPLIFETAAQRCGIDLATDWTADAWVIGDHAPADIAGAAAAGLRSVWLHHGRPWSEQAYRPTHSAATLPEAVALVLAEGAAVPAAAAAAPNDAQRKGKGKGSAQAAGAARQAEKAGQWAEKAGQWAEGAEEVGGPALVPLERLAGRDSPAAAAAIAVTVG